MDAAPPNTLDELLAVVPGVGRLRSINCDLLRVLLNRQRGECTACGKIVPKGRRTWCGSECENALLPRIQPARAIGIVEARDRGLCRLCGRDTRKSERIWRHHWRDAREPVQTSEVAVLLGYGRGAWREVDHETPVCHGGGLCRLERLRLLCGACHQDVTKQLARARAGK